MHKKLPIIARFLRYVDRQYILSKARALKDTGCGISVDFPREIGLQRKALEKKRAVERKDGKCAFFSRTEPDKLYIDGVLIPL